MNNDIIQAYLWQDFIKFGFSPSGTKDQKSWLHMYVKSLNDFWEVDELLPAPKTENGFLKLELNFLQINISIDYSIKNNSKFSARFLHVTNTRDLMWTHEVDDDYFAFPEQSLLNKYKQEKQAKKKKSNKDIERAVDGLIFHPRVHQHIESPISNHDIRIGGGIYNPFVFLFHLRYQLCPDKVKRDKEKKRIVKLFEDAIENKKAVISASDLLITN